MSPVEMHTGTIDRVPSRELIESMESVDAPEWLLAEMRSRLDKAETGRVSETD